MRRAAWASARRARVPRRGAASRARVIKCGKYGPDVLHDPLLNKGTAFPKEELERLGLRGLVPPAQFQGSIPIEAQVHRVMQRLRELGSDLERYEALASLSDRNETVFYRALVTHLEELAPIVYTPTVGKACQNFGKIFRRARGMFFSSSDRGHMHVMAHNWPAEDVRVIVVTDGSRILGLGDLGLNGMGIPIGKLALYTACAGIHPEHCLPVLLDVGTANEALLKDPSYQGLRQRRLTGDEYFETFEELMSALTSRWPHALIHMEDFSNGVAEPLLTKYRDRLLAFNDDIQGTGVVALSGILAGLRARGLAPQKLCDQRIVMVGAGSAGLGICNAIRFAMTSYGMSSEESLRNFVLLDDRGVLGEGRATASGAQDRWVRDDLRDGMGLAEAVRETRPTVLIGVTGVGGLFSEDAVREMARHCDRPLVFPLSNPTSHAECTAEQAYEWTDGRAIFASGSPFGPVRRGDVTLHPSQLNNMAAFPGVGLASVTCQLRRINRDMLLAAAEALAASVPQAYVDQGRVFPPINSLREVTLAVALAIAKRAREYGLARADCGSGKDADLLAALKSNMWQPEYAPIAYAGASK